MAVVVTRWFGGILLGSGGLVRAYGGTAALCLRAAEKIELVERQRAEIACDFADLALIRARLAARGVTTAAETFTDTGSVLSVEIPQNAVDEVSALVSDLSRGKALLKLCD